MRNCHANNHKERMMRMNAIKQNVDMLVYKELNSANAHFPLFHSHHEGYAVILEEVQEAVEKAEQMRQRLEMIWRLIRGNNLVISDGQVDMLRNEAIDFACEAIQVAAMCQKFRMSLR